MRKILAGLVLLAVVLSVWVSGNAYILRRLVFAPAWGEPATSLLTTAVAFLGSLPFFQPIVEHFAGARRSRWLAWPGFLYMGLALLLIVGIGASNVVLAIIGAAIPATPAATLAVARAQAAAVVLVALAAGGTAIASGLRHPALRRVTVRLDRWPAGLDGFRIAQISDVHIGAILDRRFAEHVVERVNALDADLIAVTGDLVDGAPEDLADHVAPFAHLRARHGVFFVTGNHDYYSGADRWIEHVARFGWRVLRNERVTIEHRGDRFDLAGVDDHRAYLFGGDHGEDVPRALAGRDPERAVVLLAHDPTTFRTAARLGVDLQLSGHTHGGQIWPFGYFVRLVVRFLAGEYERDGAKLIVSCGTGFWGPPMRLAAPSEITEIVLRPALGVREPEPRVAA
ncbi:MAG TPA: metallophosphoesterase [Candidatus Binatia bacterium]|nr:metallophosphoesterase [Candidatus Binatia bacterium]